MAFDIGSFYTREMDHHRAVFDRTVESMRPALAAWVDLAERTVRAGGKIMFCGNGGSAADAQHIAAELSVKLCAPRAPIAALCLSLDPSAMTACANDFGYDRVFARQVEALGRAEDLFVGITTSGNSPNIIAAIEVAKERGIGTVLLTGESGGKASPMVDLAIKIPCADSTARIQEMHILLGHMFCAALEQRLGLVSAS